MLITVYLMFNNGSHLIEGLGSSGLGVLKVMQDCMSQGLVLRG